MENIIIREHWDYERREDGHYFTNDRGYFVIPLDLNNGPKEREYYCYFSFFLKEEYKDVEEDEVEEYVKWFFIYLSKGNLKRSNLTYDYKFYQEGNVRTKKEGYLGYVFAMNREDMIETLSGGFTLVELYLRDMGIDFNYPRKHYNTFYLFPKKKLMDKFNLIHYEVSDVYFSNITVYYKLQYNDIGVTITRELKDNTPVYRLRDLRLNKKKTDKDNSFVLSEILGLIFQEVESNLTDEVFKALENDIYGFKGLIGILFEEKELRTEITDLLEEEIFLLTINMSLPESTKERIKNRE